MKKNETLNWHATVGFGLICLSLFFSLDGLSQQQTRNTPSTEREAPATHKVLIIPFEPKLYMSEIDRFVNAETKLSAKEIRFKFRDGINEQIYKALRASKFAALDLMADTIASRKDLMAIYQVLAYDYVKVPDQAKYKAPQREKTQKKLEKGQLQVETNSDMRFMDAHLTSPTILSTLQSKYKTDVFVFINQLDLKASGSKDPGELGEGNASRKIVLHYTIFDAKGNEINSGIIEEEFEPTNNVPKKIVDRHFSKVAIVLAQRLNKALQSPRQ
jgi:hypothetical protein